MKNELLDIMVCPVCKGPLEYWRRGQVLVCPFDRLAYPIRDGVPALLEEEATELTTDEVRAGDVG